MYMVIMNREDEYDDDSRFYNIAVTDKEDKAKKICKSLNDLVIAYKSYTTKIASFKDEYTQQNPKPVQKQVIFSSKKAPAYDDDKYMTVSKEYFDSYAEHLQLVDLAERDFQSAIDKWSDELDRKIQEKFPDFKFENFKYHELLEERYSQFGEHCSFFYQEIEFIK